jgi:hypothetical protein
VKDECRRKRSSPTSRRTDIKLADDPGLAPNCRAVIVDPIVENLDFEPKLSKRSDGRFHVAGIEKEQFRFHEVSHGFFLRTDRRSRLTVYYV